MIKVYRAMPFKAVEAAIKAIADIIPRSDVRFQTREMDAWQEVTLPTVGDRAYVYSVDIDEHEGTIIVCDQGTAGPDTYTIEMDDGVTIFARPGDFRVSYDRVVASYPQFWQLRHEQNQRWLKTKQGLVATAVSGFRVYENAKGECILGMDTCDPKECLRRWKCLLYVAKETYHYDLCDV